MDHTRWTAPGVACTGTSAGHSHGSHKRDCARRCLYWHVSRLVACITSAGLRAQSLAHQSEDIHGGAPVVQPRAFLPSLVFTSAEGCSSYTCSHRHLRALAISRTHRALTHRALDLVQDLTLALDIIIIVVTKASASRSNEARSAQLCHLRRQTMSPSSARTADTIASPYRYF